ncbi:hypothetical protein BB560_005457, partial [Smittium megazygosporum]
SIIRNKSFKKDTCETGRNQYWSSRELQQTKSVAARNRTSDLPDLGRPYEPKGYNVKPEFQEFEEVNLWSDSGAHFKNADYLYSLRLELPQIFSSKKFKWFKEIERNRYLLSIEDLVSAFREKAQVSGNISDNIRVYHFQIYRKDVIRGLRIRAKLMTCPLSLPDLSKYFNIGFRIKVKRDIRTNKYAPDRSNPLVSDTDIMGSTSRNTQRIRVEMLRGIGVSLSSLVVL